MKELHCAFEKGVSVLGKSVEWKLVLNENAANQTALTGQRKRNFKLPSPPNTP